MKPEGWYERDKFFRELEVTGHELSLILEDWSDEEIKRWLSHNREIRTKEDWED